MHPGRPDRGRRRFHTRRVALARRARYLASWPDGAGWPGTDDKLALGRLDKTDPWDCGNPRCGICHEDRGYSSRRRARERAWLRDIDM